MKYMLVSLLTVFACCGLELCAQTTSQLHPCGFKIIDDPIAAPQTTTASDVNDKGTIVGAYLDQTPSSQAHGFILKGDEFKTIDFPGGTGTHLIKINNLGQILGSVDSSPNSQTPVSFILENGKFTVLNFPDVPSNGISGLNDFDDFIGIDQRTGLQGFVVAAGKRIDLPSFEGAPFLPAGINDRGVVVGSSPAGGPAILRYGQYSPLPASGASQTSANAINNRNQIVGGTFNPSDSTSQAFFLSEDGTYTLFGFPGDPQNSAIAINNHLQVLGVSSDASFNTKRWVTTLCTSGQ